MTPWWTRAGLEVRDQRLLFAGHDAERIAREHGTPLYVYDPERVTVNVGRLRAAFTRAGVPHRIHYALKANRHPEYLARLRSLGDVGIDACSPQEVSLALEAGWQPREISYTGTNLSERDLDVILPQPLVLNLDSLSAIRRVARRARGRAIGLRINPQVGTGYSAQLTYAGEKPTKFGIYPDRFDEALELARESGLEVRGLHFHIGSGWLRAGLGALLKRRGSVPVELNAFSEARADSILETARSAHVTRIVLGVETALAHVAALEYLASAFHGDLVLVR